MLVHYVIVRKDLPIGVLAAMTVHAAGESAASLGPGFAGATAVVLEAKDEAHLNEIYDYLWEAKFVDVVLVHEPDGPYHGQLMAIGVVPGERETLGPLMKKFTLLGGA